MGERSPRMLLQQHEAGEGILISAPSTSSQPPLAEYASAAWWASEVAGPRLTGGCHVDPDFLFDPLEDSELHLSSGLPAAVEVVDLNWVRSLIDAGEGVYHQPPTKADFHLILRCCPQASGQHDWEFVAIDDDLHGCPLALHSHQCGALDVVEFRNIYLRRKDLGGRRAAAHVCRAGG